MKNNASGPRASLVRILGAVGFVAALAFLLVDKANFLIGRSLLIAFGDNESTYGRAWYEWDGDVVASDVAIHPNGSEDEDTLRFERVHLETPGWWWVAYTLYDRRLRRTRLDRIHVTLDGGTTTSAYDPTLGDLGPFSLVAASPFEAEGCMEDAYWLRDELVEMSLEPGSSRLEFDYRVEGTQLLTTITLDTPGVSRVRYDREEQLGDRINALVLDQYASFAKSERWQIDDQGFVKARNLWCTKKDGITTMQFVQRHTDSVERLLETAGLAVDAATRDAYLAFTRDGGTLVFEGDYVQPLHSDLFYDLRATGEALPAMNGRLEHGSKRVAVSWSEFDPRPLQFRDDEGATFAVLQRERGVDAPMGAIASPPATPPSAARTIPPASTTSVAVPPAAAVTTPATAVRAPAPAVATLTTVAPTTPVELRWSDLSQYKGRRVRIWTRHNPPRTVELLEIGAQQIRVQARLGGGHAQYSIGRDSFSRATLLP